ncbi:GalNAc(5)-diNAcBac-PP-undecaprenol beta-1,3-glucosyltransferase [Pseudomonas sp. 37 R 15]|uniref:glycosyltransferase family 2 protein n=1 Tax=Pseudomonas sp. 37 R 15 TaxID=1844104 RepID=UPI000811EB8B|nr:glycosyltransferase family A protein [Pseudomonas sp. 37 R 15]CRM79611.1 GalNAc(5)-diNAcBac-PP-undecaprenol beta-1,3-glucosyltransferase [Pseudomonas sp. 37 R 15]
MHALQNGSVPYFSIVIPTYNRPMLLRRALLSVRAQRFRDFEVVIVDDGSTPSCAPAVEEFADLPLRFIYQKGNQGAACARNTGIDASRGRYITFLDDDDEYLASFLEQTYATLVKAEGRVFFTWCGAELLNYSAHSTSEFTTTTRTFCASPSADGSTLEDLFSIGIGFGVTVKSDCLKKVGGFDERLRTVEDTDLFFRLVLADYQAGVVPGTHLRLHNHHQSRLTGVANHERRIDECRWLLERYESFLAKNPVLRSQLHWQISNLQKQLFQTDDSNDAPTRDRP